MEAAIDAKVRNAVCSLAKITKSGLNADILKKFDDESRLEAVIAEIKAMPPNCQNSTLSRTYAAQFFMAEQELCESIFNLSKRKCNLEFIEKYLRTVGNIFCYLMLKVDSKNQINLQMKHANPTIRKALLRANALGLLSIPEDLEKMPVLTEKGAYHFSEYLGFIKENYHAPLCEMLQNAASLDNFLWATRSLLDEHYEDLLYSDGKKTEEAQEMALHACGEIQSAALGLLNARMDITGFKKREKPKYELMERLGIVKGKNLTPKGYGVLAAYSRQI